jgi:hypothetical protein
LACSMGKRETDIQRSRVSTEKDQARREGVKGVTVSRSNARLLFNFPL